MHLFQLIVIHFHIAVIANTLSLNNLLAKLSFLPRAWIANCPCAPFAMPDGVLVSKNSADYTFRKLKSAELTGLLSLLSLSLYFLEVKLDGEFIISLFLMLNLLDMELLSLCDGDSLSLRLGIFFSYMSITSSPWALDSCCCSFAHQVVRWPFRPLSTR